MQRIGKAEGKTNNHGFRQMKVWFHSELYEKAAKTGSELCKMRYILPKKSNTYLLLKSMNYKIVTK